MQGNINLESKLTHPEQLAESALDDPSLLKELLDGIAPQHQKSTRRENCSQALMFMAETWPQILLPHWDYFVKLMSGQNGFSKYVAIYVIASLVKEDKTSKFKQSWNNYRSLLDDDSVMVASHAALNAAKIAKIRPDMREDIIMALLKIDETHHEAGHLGLIKAYIIEGLDLLYEQSTKKSEILSFVRAQMQAPSTKAVKNAKAFLKKWDI